MDTNPKYITANIQGMFNLQKLIFEAYEELERIASLPDDKFNDDIFSLQDALLTRLCDDHKHLLEKFTPMHCKHCSLKKNCNFERDNGVCSDYEVEVEVDNGYGDRRY
jgi:hypothetical protein